MLTIGLTGGIGTGKSLVSEILEALGAQLVNADMLGHRAYLPSTKGFDQIVKCFGKRIVGQDGLVDRKILGKLVFADVESMSALNDIVHPIIFDLVQNILENNLNNGADITVVEAAILIEAGWQELFDEIWVVGSNQDVVIERLQLRNGMNRENVLSRINSQIPQKERMNYADEIIDNSGTVEELRNQVKELWDKKIQKLIRS